jgi:hypothetical protein
MLEIDHRYAGGRRRRAAGLCDNRLHQGEVIIATSHDGKIDVAKDYRLQSHFISDYCCCELQHFAAYIISSSTAISS